MTLDQRIRLILDGPLATFARGGGGGAKGGKKGKAAKAKGAVQAGGKGGVCCKGPGGKFAPGNNYGSLNSRSVSPRAALKSKMTGIEKQARAASTRAKGPAAASGAGMTPAARIAARSKLASTLAAREGAKRDLAKMDEAKRVARNTAARERRAAKKEAVAKQGAAKPARDAAIGRMVGKSRETAGNKMVAKTEREMAARNAAERGKAVGRMVGKSREASAKKAETAKAPTKASGRGTPERAERATTLRVERAAATTLKGLAKEYPNGLVPIPVLRDRLAAKLGPAAAGKVLDRVLLDKHGENLIAISDLRKATKEQLAKAVPGVNETLYYVKVPRSPTAQASALKTLTGKSKAAAERAGAVMKGPVTAENIAARGREARKAQARAVRKSAANRPAQPASDRGAVQAARAAMRARSAAEVASRPKTTPVQTVPHRVGSVPRRDVAGQVAATTARIDAGRKASGRGTPERAAKAAALRAGRAKAGAASLPPIAGKQSERSKRDLAGAAPAGPTSATARTMVARGMARERMVRASREAAQGARMVATRRANAAAAAKAPTKAAGRGTPERMANAAATREARIGLQRVPRSAPIEVGKPVTYGGRKVLTVRRGAAELKIEQVQRGGKEYRVVTSYYGSQSGAPGGVGRVSRELDRFDSLAAAKDYAREQIATVGSVEPGGKLRPRPRRRRA